MFLFCLMLQIVALIACGTSVKDKIETYSQTTSADIGTVLSDSDGLSVSATDSLAGTSVIIPPGALSVGTSVSIATAGSIVGNSAAGALGVDDLSAAGPSVLLESTGATVSAHPMSVSLPLSSGLALSSENLIVVYKTFDSSSMALSPTNVYLGVIPRDRLRVKSKSVSFLTKRFGAYQLAYTQTSIAEPIEVSTPEPIAKTEIQDENLFVGLWRESCEVYENRESYSFKVLVSEDGSYTETIDEFHDDLNCNPSYLSRTQMIQGRIEPGTQYADGSIDIDIIPQRFFYAFRDDVKMDQANREGFCSITKWQRHKFEEVTDDHCVPSHDRYTIYQLVLAERDRLYVGDDGGQIPFSESERPTRVDKNRYFQRD